MASNASRLGTAVPFNCGVCSKALTDRTALLTSCGHFFCTAQPATCTRLRPAAPAGTCEQCGKKCDAGTLANKAAGYDQRVQSFVFDDAVVLTQTLCDILKFRETHRVILNDNTQHNLQQLDKLKEECRNLKRDASEMCTERDRLRDENENLRRDSGKAHAQMSKLRQENDRLHDRLQNARHTELKTPPTHAPRRKRQSPSSSSRSEQVTNTQVERTGFKTETQAFLKRSDRMVHHSKDVRQQCETRFTRDGRSNRQIKDSKPAANHYARQTYATTDFSSRQRHQSNSTKRQIGNHMGGISMFGTASRVAKNRRNHRNLADVGPLPPETSQTRPPFPTGRSYLRRSTGTGQLDWQKRALTVPRPTMRQGVSKIRR